MTSKLVLLLTLIYQLTLSNCDYWSLRETILKQEESQIIGGNNDLSLLEKMVNDILMKKKLNEVDRGFTNPELFLPSRSFFKTKNNISKSEVYQFIEKIPKGCSLHGHDLALTSFDYIYNVTYYENLYACETDGLLKLHFFRSDLINNECDWKLINKWREEDKTFDERLINQMTIIVPNPEVVYQNINDVWSKFANIFPFIEPLLSYKPVFQEQMYQVLLELYEDNVRYVEFRGYLPTVYDLDGRTYNQTEVVGLYIEAVELFKENYKDFQGARLIYAPHRKVNNETMSEYIKTVRILKEKYPNFVAGFDLVGQEDLGNPLIDFVKDLQNLSKEMNVFYHAGETNWYGQSTDLNVIDAILLGTKRIGHGYALSKHPTALRLIKERDIAIEVSPISNQVLKLVDDIRNHPAITYISEGYPIVICNDDPGLWGAKALSYDWYMTFVGMTSRNTDLRFLKQLALNSYLYNAMDNQEKEDAIKQWRKDWSKFLLEVIGDTYTNVVVT